MDQQPKPLDLDTIEQRAEKATPGPWWNDNFEIYTSEHVGIPAMCTWIGETCTVDLPDHGDANGAFIANAREDIPTMAAEIRRLRAELAKYVGHEPTIAEEMAYLRTENDRLRAELEQAQQRTADRAPGTLVPPASFITKAIANVGIPDALPPDFA